MAGPVTWRIRNFLSCFVTVRLLPIWEGTTNILSLDALRVLQREDVLGDLLSELRVRIESVPAALIEARQNILEAIDGIGRLLHRSLRLIAARSKRVRGTSRWTFREWLPAPS